MTKPVPEGIQGVTPAMTVDGAAEAIELYKKAFGAEEISRAIDPTGKKIWHAAIRIGGSTIFINDHFPEMGGPPNQTRLWLYQANVDAAFGRAVEAGMRIKMALGDMFWGDRVGTVRDKWGNEFTLAMRIKDLTPEEMQKAQIDFVAQMATQKA